MKFTVFLSGFLLLFLLPDWTESVDINTLARIVNYFEENYSIDNDQYAVAINVPEDQCQENFNPTQNNFLTQENAENVRNAITYEINRVYQGQELIAAGIKKKQGSSSYDHSEFLLLRPTGISPMTNLLNRRNNGCSVFFTFNSPCVKSCLKRNYSRNILDGLNEWSRHSGMKAFVFKNIWGRDLGKNLENAFKRIAAHIPLFRCVNENQCYACDGEGNNPINPLCLP